MSLSFLDFILDAFHSASPHGSPFGSIDVALANDTGVSATDGLTYDAAISGQIDIDHLASFEVAVDARGLRGYSDARSFLAADGSFEIDAAALAGLKGVAALGDGRHTVSVRAKDTAGHTFTDTLTFRLDTSGPGATIGLSSDSDTGYRGDGRTEIAVVDLTGTTDAFARVEIDGVSATADARGRFVIDDLALDIGVNALVVTITDAAGNESTQSLNLTRLENSVLRWNAITLEAIQETGTAPMYASRLLAMESMAVWQVTQDIDEVPTSHFPLFSRYASSSWWGGLWGGNGGVSLEAAIAQAAHDVLLSVYASDSGPYAGSAALRAELDAELAASLAEVPDGRAEQRGITLGSRIAREMIAERENDGWNAFIDPSGEISDEIGAWRPTGPGYANPLAPHWGDVDPWFVTSSQQFLPEPPPAIDSLEYAEEYAEVMALGALDSNVRTADQTEIALFWADGAGTITPPGHWNQIAAEISAAEGQSSAEAAETLAKLNVAMADAAITCWETKYTFDLWRPITAIQNGDVDDNAGTIGDADWQPLITTPPFPEYTSGHSTFSGAAAAILTAEFGMSYAFTTGTTSSDPGLVGVTRDFASFWAAANEAGRSRIYGGIHFESANKEGLDCGAQIGSWVLSRFDA